MVSMVLIADSHVSPAQGNITEFREMLAALAESPHGVVFLGDILDLWIALPGYETALHEEFVAWCRRESAKRVVGFVEGNHEFFLVEGHADAFTFTASEEFLDAENRLFTHGDTINQNDWSYRVFRRLVKNPFTRWLEKVVPGGPALARFIKDHLNARRDKLPKFFPEANVAAYIDERIQQGAKAVYMGHFHGRHCLERPGGGHGEVIPAWCGSGQVVLVEKGSLQGVVYHWRDVPGMGAPNQSTKTA